MLCPQGCPCSVPELPEEKELCVFESLWFLAVRAPPVLLLRFRGDGNHKGTKTRRNELCVLVSLVRQAKPG